MSAWRAARAVALGLLLGLLFTQFGLSLMRVEGRSMAPTLEGGEVVLVVRPFLAGVIGLLTGEEPALAERGAIVVLPQPRPSGVLLGLGRPLIVKRVVGLPGERVAFASGRLLVNGEELPEPWLDEEHAGAPRMTPRLVPAGELFLVGDNRLPLASSDSRSFGPQPVAAVRGRAVARLRAPWGPAGPRWPVAALP